MSCAVKSGIRTEAGAGKRCSSWWVNWLGAWGASCSRLLPAPCVSLMQARTEIDKRRMSTLGLSPLSRWANHARI